MPDLPSTMFPGDQTTQPVPFEVGIEQAEDSDATPDGAETYDGVIYLDRVPVFRHRVYAHRHAPWPLVRAEVSHRAMAAFAHRLAALLTPEDPE